MTRARYYRYLRTGLILVLGVVLGVSFWATVKKQNINQVEQPSAVSAQDKNRGQEQEEPFWKAFAVRTISDPVTLYTLVLTLFTGLLWRSTEKLWNAGERQRKVSEGAVAIAREANFDSRAIGEAQTRAYLTCTGAKIEYSRISCAVSISLINKGQSPALNVFARTKLYLTLRSGLLTVKPIAGNIMKFIERRSQKPGILIAAGETDVCNVAWVSLDTLSATSFTSIISLGIYDAELRGEIFWHDVFNKSHSIPFWLRVDSEGNISTPNQTPENPSN